MIANNGVDALGGGADRAAASRESERDHPCNHAHGQAIRRFVVTLTAACGRSSLDLVPRSQRPDGETHSRFEAQAMPIPMSRSGVCGLVKGGGAMLIVGGVGSTAASAAQAGFSGVSCCSRIDLVWWSRACGTVRPLAQCCQSSSALSRSCSQAARPAWSEIAMSCWVG